MPSLDNNRFAPLLKDKMSAESYRKLIELDNESLFMFVGEYTELCEPDSVYICDDSDEDAEYIRQNSLRGGEEKPLSKKGHTIHYDGYD
ncbi:MAG: phosphoenolpyruvate carboxykinase, partial [Deltaproteobacteria bacterium]|nr:phosphoenolpyruvate carboxykinase [Deltaproteobacteria bacterium]